MRRSIALWRNVHWPPLDDILAVGVPFPRKSRKEKHDVDHRRA